MTLGFSVAFLGSIASGTIAVFSLLKAGRSSARWSFGLGMLILGIESLCSALAADAAYPHEVVVWEGRAFIAMSLLPATWLFFSLTYGRGNQADFLRSWRIWLALAFGLPVACWIFFYPQLLFAVSQTAGSWAYRLGPSGFALNIFFVITCILVLMNLEATFRASVGTMRWRIKYVVLGLGALFAVRAYTATQLLLFKSLSLARNDFNSAALLFACLLVLRSLLRAGHFEVGVYPSQSILQNSITLILAGAYLIAVGLLARIVVLLKANTSFEAKAFFILVALVSLAVALLSDRVRLHIRRFASHHFQRPLHDYRTVWRLFTEGTTRRVERADLCFAVVRLVSEIFQALSVSIWVLDENRLVLGASTLLTQSPGQDLSLTHEEVAQLVESLKARREPIDLDSSEEGWVSSLRRSHPNEFPRGGDRFCVPMLAGGELLGIVIVGDRVGGVPFSLQDMELLKCASNQAAAGLLNSQLSQRLSQSKQLEAFQAMSAFFVHDLKNTASTLSLMLQNLPLHYQDPAFREETLRGISKSVSHIDQLIARLTVLRHDLALQLVECNLNDVVGELLKGCQNTNGVEYETELRKLPKIPLDPLQIQKVLTNLILNAQEAMVNGGKIRVETSQRDGWIVLTVADNGCGMSPEFVQRSLFRPFKTTKQRGLGIGMFHCKMIVEAHHGRIEVDSKVGSGTAFRVLLPTTQRT